MGSFHQLGNFVHTRSDTAYFKVPKCILCHLDQLPCSNIEPHKSQAGHDSGNRHTEGDRSHVIRASLDVGCRQESDCHQPEIYELEALASVQREPVPRVSLGLRLGILHNANATLLRRAALADPGVRSAGHRHPGVADPVGQYKMSAPALSSLDGRTGLESQRVLETWQCQVIVFEQRFAIRRPAVE